MLIRRHPRARLRLVTRVSTESPVGVPGALRCGAPSFRPVDVDASLAASRPPQRGFTPSRLCARDDRAEPATGGAERTDACEAPTPPEQGRARHPARRALTRARPLIFSALFWALLFAPAALAQEAPEQRDAGRSAPSQQGPAEDEGRADPTHRDGGVGDAGSSGAETEDAGTDEPPRDAAVAEGAEDEAEGLEPPPARGIPALPSAEPAPEIAPIVLGRRPDEGAPKVVEPVERPALVIKTILGLLALLTLAYLGSHAKVQAFERRIGISQVITAGFPFVVLGVIARHPSVGILSDAVLVELSPVLRIGLGSIGFVSGFRLRAAAAGARSAGSFVALATLVPFLLVMVPSSLLLLLFSGESWRDAISDPVFLRDAIILGTAGAMAAKPSAEALRASDTGSVLPRVIRLEELIGMTGLSVVAAFFRPAGPASWQIPGVAWLLLTVGLGTAMSAVTYAMLQRVKRGPEFLVLALGAISFTAGMAGYLHLSPLAVGFICGAMLVSFPGDFKGRLESALRGLERPIYRVSLIAIGALWQVEDLRGWALVPVFVGMRLLGKYLGTLLGERYGEFSLTNDERRALSIPPMGPLSIAIVVNAQLLYPGGSISLIVAAVIGGAIFTEIAVQLVGRTNGRSDPPRRPSVVEEPAT